MRLFLLIFATLTFTACQKPGTTVLPSAKQQLQVEELIEGIKRCQRNSACLDTLNVYFSELAEQRKIENELDSELPEEQEVEQNHDINPTLANNDWLSNEPLLANTRIQAALNEWLTWKRPKLLETWNNYQYLKAQIHPPFIEKNIPESLLLAIIAQESGGRVHSMSSAGASGLFQLMPATADRFGVRGTIGDYDARFHPESAAKGAANYIEEQRQIYGDDFAKILAAYNAGENRFKRLNKKHNGQSVWNNQFFYDLPGETQDYIAIVLSAKLIFETPEAYNVELKELDGTTALIRAKTDTSLSELAVCFGQHNNEIGWYRVLRNLNATTKAKRVIKQNTVVVIPNQLKPIYETTCQDTNLMAMAKKIHDADFPDRPEFTWYKIQQGDSLSSISRKFKCSSRQEIAQLNKLKAPRYLINAGKKLKVPQC